MISTSTAVAIAALWVWWGMVLAISFLEAPLKFRAPGVTVPIGLGIGRLVFRALNVAELLLAVVIVVVVIVRPPGTAALTAILVAVAVLAAQLLLVRPRLARRSDAVLAGADAPRSHAHLVYVGLEVLKALALPFAGVALLVG